MWIANVKLNRTGESEEVVTQLFDGEQPADPPPTKRQRLCNH